MSNNIFPTFQGWSWEKTKTPTWETTLYKHYSGRQTRVQKWSYPKYKIELKFNFMTDNSCNSISLDKGDIEKFISFFNSVGGAADDFLFLDDVENSVTNQTFGVGDGLKTKFQLVRNVDTWVEPVKGLAQAPTIKINNVASQNFTWDAKGLITFNTAPANGATLTWSGQYYFRCRFQDDTIDLQRTWDALYEDVAIKMETVK